MAQVLDRVKGIITGYDERRGVLLIEAPYGDINTLMRREYKNVVVQLNDSRKLSDEQRRSCYAMLGEIADWMGEIPSETKELMKIEFMQSELYDIADGMFSLSDAPMSLVAAFQSFLAQFIVRNDIPTKYPMLTMVDDVADYVYSCLINKKCCICGKRAELHHVDRVGMGNNRHDIIHEGLEVLPLCREHHSEAHAVSDKDFFDKWHLGKGIEMDKTLCRIYKVKKRKVNDEQCNFDGTAHKGPGA